MAHPWMHNKEINGYAQLPHDVGWEDKGWEPFDGEPTPEQLDAINAPPKGNKSSKSDAGK